MSETEQRREALEVDLDRQGELEAENRMLKERLAQAQKLTALGELVSTTTHEFNNVLMTILNYAKLGLRHPDAETAQKSFEKILGAANRASKITNSILGFARNRAPQFESTDMVKLIDDTLLLLEREMVKYRIHVEKILDDVPQAWANTNQIQQVLLNLLINARQAMQQGGRILIKLTHDPESNMVELMVRDSGAGMTHEVMRKIFDPFFSTKQGPDESGKGGTGLGLSACRDIIETHQGRIRVDSTVGKGTAFTIKLPVARQEIPASQQEVRSEIRHLSLDAPLPNSASSSSPLPNSTLPKNSLPNFTSWDGLSNLPGTRETQG